MNRQQQIDVFLLEAHRLAASRLRANPERLGEAAELLQRWRQRSGPTRSDPYWDEWEALIAKGVAAVTERACASDDHAAVLRSVSPLSVLVTQQERLWLLRDARSMS